ncbi:MAG: iron-containing alcohol dehydrogenase [Candidatus Binataceae bacterium]
MLTLLCAPARYIQGRDATRQLGPEMAKLGLNGRAMVIAGRSAIRSLSTMWEQTFAGAGISFRVRQFGGECSTPEIDAGVAEAKVYQAEVIVGAGGGKCLDTARARLPPP